MVSGAEVGGDAVVDDRGVESLSCRRLKRAGLE